MDDNQKKAETFYVVEATYNEQHTLWVEWSQEALTAKCSTSYPERRVSWQQDSKGYWTEIGVVMLRKKGHRKTEEMPICVSVFWFIVQGKRVAFYEATSQVVDHRMVEAWVKKEFPNAKGETNASNFRLAVDEIKETNVAAVEVA